MRRILLVLAGMIGLLTSGARAQDIDFTNWFYDGPVKAAFDQYITSFKKLYPAAGNVNVQTIPFQKYDDTLNVRLASGTPPDIAWLLAGDGPAMIDAGRLMDLTPYVKAYAGYNVEDFGPAIEPWTKDGKIYALPYTNASNAVYYNVDIFKKAGIPTPRELQAQGKWTWDTVRAIAKDLKAKGGARYGFVFGNSLFTSGWQNLVDIFPSYGGGPWSADGKTCTLSSPQSVAALQLVYNMMYVDKTHPQPGIDVDFATGDIAMSLTRPTFAFRLKDVPFKWDIIVAPSGPKGFVPSRAQNVLVAFKDAPHAALGAQFAVHSTAPAQAALWTGSAPPRQSLQTLQVMLPANALTADQLNTAVIPAMAATTYQLEYTHKNYGALQPEVQRLFSALMWTDGVDVAAATKSVCDQIAPLLQ